MGDIFDEMRSMQEEMDRMFSNLFRHRRLLAASKEGKDTAITKHDFRMPVADVYETESSVIAAIELPGVAKEDIELNVTEHEVEVKAQKKLEQEQKRKGFYRYESSSRQFYRKMPLPAAVKPSTTKAEYKNGMLRIEIAKEKKAEKKKRIGIR
jgi:HSP20 family protein